MRDVGVVVDDGAEVGEGAVWDATALSDTISS